MGRSMTRPRWRIRSTSRCVRDARNVRRSNPRRDGPAPGPGAGARQGRGRRAWWWTWPPTTPPTAAMPAPPPTVPCRAHWSGRGIPGAVREIPAGPLPAGRHLLRGVQPAWGAAGSCRRGAGRHRVGHRVEFPWPHIPGGQAGQRRSGTGRTDGGEHDGVRRAGVEPGPAGAGDDSVGSGRNGKAAPVQGPGRFHSRPNRQPPNSLSSGRVAVPDGKPMTGEHPAGRATPG